MTCPKVIWVGMTSVALSNCFSEQMKSRDIKTHAKIKVLTTMGLYIFLNNTKLSMMIIKNIPKVALPLVSQ